MNKTIAMIAVVLSVLTAFLLIGGTGVSDGTDTVEDAAGNQYYVINDADTTVYTDSMLTSITTSGRFYIASESIMDNAFKNCTKIKYVLLGDAKTVGDSAFEGCTALLSVLSYDNLTTIGDSAFRGDVKLKEARFPATLTSIGEDAFNGCTALKGPILFGTNVTKIKSGTFMNSGLIAEDLRNVTSISSTAFSNTNMEGQILMEGQTAKVSGVPAIYVKDFDVKSLSVIKSKSGCTIKIQVENGVSLMRTTSEGTSTVDSQGLNWVSTNYFCNIVMDGTDFHLEPVKYRIHFEDYLGMDDVVHISGSGTYTMPAPSIGASIFSGWKIDGFPGYVTSLTETNFQTIGTLIEPVAEFQTLTLTMDHSDVSASPDYSGLQTSTTFTLGGTYPDMDDIMGFNFSGWKVGNTFYAPGATITNLSNHTAKSVWNADMKTVTLVHADNSETIQQVQTGTVLNLSDLITTEPESKRFIGWSLTSNGSVMTSNPTVTADMKLYSVFTDRTVHTIRYMDGTSVLQTQTGYDGRTVTLNMDDPQSEGRIFIKWMLGDTEVEHGDPILLDSDKDVQSIWNIITLNLAYHIEEGSSNTYDYGTNVTADCAVEGRMGLAFTGWSTTEHGPVVYTNGDVIVMINNVDLYPCWTSNGMLVVTLHDYTGRSSQTEVEPNSAYIIPVPTPRENKTFTGWAIVTSGTAVYQTGAVLNITDHTDLYETWSDIIIHTVTMYHYDGNSDVSNVNSGSDYTIPAVTVRENYDFLGWATTPNGNAVYRDEETVRISSDLSIYEKWQEKSTFTVTVHSDTPIVKTAYEGQTVSVTLPSMSRSGYSLSGWSTLENASSAQYTSNTNLTVSRTTDYYPVWDALDTYYITVHLDGDETKNYSIYEGESITLPASIGRSEGKIHEGWTTNSNGTGTFYSAGSTIYPDSSLELYPHWSDPVFVKLSLNNGNTNMSVINTLVGEDCDLSSTNVSKDGYILIGWSKSKSSTSIAYAVDGKIKMNYDTTIYAVWEKLISVSFIDGDSVRIAHIKSGTPVELPVLEKDDATFLGWTISGSDRIIESLSPTKDTELVASWEVVQEPIVIEEPVEDVPEPVETVEEPKEEEPEIPKDVEQPKESNEEPEIVFDTESESSGSSGIPMTVIGIGAAVAAIVSALLVFQMRRA